MNALPLSLMFAAGSLICAGLGAVHDVRERKIPNRITLPAMIAALLLHTILGGWSGLASSILAGIIAGVIFLIFFLAGGMGGGDVKLMIAVGCFAGLPLLRMVIIATVLAGAVFAIAVGIYSGRMRETLRNVTALVVHHSERGLTPHPDLNLSNAATLRLPFALPIATGCLFTFCVQLMGVRP